MAIELTLIRCLIKDISDIGITPGQYIHCPDVNRTFYDIKDNTRIEADVSVEEEALSTDQITSPVVNRIYYLQQRKRFYIFTTEGYKNVVYDTDVLELYGSYALIPFTIENPATGLRLAPRTLASAVYASNGESVENLLNNFTRVSKYSATKVASYDNQTIFQIPYPFSNYFESGNIMDVYVNGLLTVKDSDYVLTANEVVFLESRHIQKDDIIIFIFLYNESAILSTDRYQTVIDGGYIANNSIPTSRLQHVTDSIYENSSDILPTSRALNTVLNTLNNKITSMATTYKGSYNVVATGTSKEILANISNFERKDGTEINVKLVVDLENGALINVNNTGPISILVNGTEETSKYKGGMVMTLVYSKDTNVYNVKLYSDYRIRKRDYFTQTKAGDNIVRFNMDEYIPGITPLTVYQNNLRLFEGINYLVKDRNAIQLINYSAENNDLFCFEIDIVEKYLM